MVIIATIAVGAIIGIFLAWILRERPAFRRNAAVAIAGIVVVAVLVLHPGKGPGELPQDIIANPTELFVLLALAFAAAALATVGTVQRILDNVAPDH